MDQEGKDDTRLKDVEDPTPKRLAKPKPFAKAKGHLKTSTDPSTQH